MGRVLTNFTSLSYAIQDDFNDLGASPDWKNLEPNGSITFGADTTTQPRSPISKNRQRQKGSIVDLDSEVSYEADLTLDSLLDFAEGFCFATAVHSDLTFRAADATATTDLFTVPSLSASQASRLAAGTLLWAAGYAEDGNNGIHEVSTGASASDTTIAATGSTLVTETAPDNAELSIAGFRCSTSDLAITVTSGVATVVSTADVSDWSTWLTVGQFVHIGGLVSGNQFSAGAGFARVKSIDGATFTADKLDSALATDPGTGETVDVLFGRFIRNVSVDSSEFLERYFEMEVGSPNLFDSPSETGYEYALNNLCNSLELGFPLTALATLTPGFIGTDTENPVRPASRKTNAANARDPLLVAGFNTSADYARLRITDYDETGLTTDFKDWTLTLNNNGSGEKVQGFLGNKFINTGNFELDISGAIVFTEANVINRVRSNTTVTMDVILENSNGGFALDIPSVTLGIDGRDYEVDSSVKLNLTAEAHEDETLGTSIGLSFFPVTPTSFAA